MALIAPYTYRRLRSTWRELLSVMLCPSCWCQNKPLSSEWDYLLTSFLDNGEHFSQIESHYATIGGFRVWTANHPYASFTLESIGRPRRSTIIRAHRVLVADALFRQYKVEDVPMMIGRPGIH